MKGRRISLLSLLLAALLLAGCVEGESAQLREGKGLMRAYLAQRGGHATITEIYPELQRPDADRRIMTDFVKGSFRDGDASYDFAVNVVSGEIYTSEGLPDLYDCCLRLLYTRLGLDPANCAGCCSLWLNVPAWQEPRAEWPDRTAHLGQVVPVALPDPEAYAEGLLSDGLARLEADIACRGETVSADRWSLADTAGWENTKVTICDLGEAPLPEAGTEWSYFRALSGDRVVLTGDEVVFQAEE